MASEAEDFDALFDAAMRQYSPEPRAGIEQRVLSRVRGELPRRRFPLWTYALPIPALALALIFLMRPAGKIEVAPQRAPELRAQTPAVHTVSVLERKPRRTVRPGRKLRSFPTPAPLTPEEQALVNFTMQRPLDAYALAARDDGKPIEIPELQIPPLQSDGGR